MLAPFIVALAALAPLAPAAKAAAAGASVTCPDDPASCDAASVGPFAAPSAEDGHLAAGPEGYATPAEIDCPVPVVPALLQALVGGDECDGTPRDAAYRASRFPESERSPGSLSSSSRPRDRRTAGAACHGVPRDGGGLEISSPQPLALFALPSLVPEVAPTRAWPVTRALPFRALEPPERPPAA